MGNRKKAFSRIFGTDTVLLRGALAAYKSGKRLTVAQLREVKKLLDQEVHSGDYTDEEMALIHDFYHIAKAMYKRIAKVVP